MAQIDRFKKDITQKATMGSINPTAASIYGKYFSIDVNNLSKYLKDMRQIFHPLPWRDHAKGCHHLLARVPCALR